jgi:hypothetical protein
MAPRNETAASIWPHLAADRPAPRETPRQTSPLAAALYPNLVPPKPKPSTPSFTRSAQGRITFGYEVVPGLRRKGR